MYDHDTIKALLETAFAPEKSYGDMNRSDKAAFEREDAHKRKQAEQQLATIAALAFVDIAQSLKTIAETMQAQQRNTIVSPLMRAPDPAPIRGNEF